MSGATSNPRSATALRFPDDLYRRLTTTAAEWGVSINWLVNRLVSEGLDDMVSLADFRLTRRDEPADDGRCPECDVPAGALHRPTCVFHPHFPPEPQP